LIIFQIFSINYENLIGGKLMDLGLNGKIALIAASSKGLGYEIAKTLAQEGTKVSICARGKEALIEAKKSIEDETGQEVFAMVCDVTNENMVKDLVTKINESVGHVQILVNNSGGPPTGTFIDIAQNEWQNAIKLNLMSTIYLTRTVIHSMIKNNWGRIINLTSISVKQPIDGLILSNSVRLAVIGFAKTLSNEVAKYNVTVNNVCPGYMRTKRVEQLAKSRASSTNKKIDEIFEVWESQIPMGRLGHPKELANLVAFLASDKASYITGASIQVDGGMFKGSL
jgi:3-oxoacyl-[acyl-carrier protein] reductase